VAYKGFNFRQTSGFVTDAAGDACVTSGDNYPVVFANGITGGFSVAVGQDRDRDGGIDARLAGLVYASASTPATFQIDLPSAGTYDIRLAIGDASFANGTATAVTVRDNATDLITLTGLSPGAGQFYDATGVLRTSAADWVSNNAASTQVFASTTLYVVLNPGGAVASPTPFAHISINDAVGGGQSIPARIIIQKA
jgi:hypothetical protein